MTQDQLRVLLVDDEASLREPLARFLREKHFYIVDVAADGQEAMIRLSESERFYQVALIDDLLPPSANEEPRPYGIELLGKIKSASPQTEVIIFTGWGMDRALEALRAGAFRYLAKPFNPDELAITLPLAAEYQRLKGDAREKQILAQLMETSAALLSSQNEQEVLDRILQGIQAIGYDRARLYLLSDTGESLIGRSQVGMDRRFVGVTWHVSEDRHMQQVIADRCSHVFKRKDGMPVHSEEFLGKEGVEEWGCVPLISKAKVIGKVSVDNKHSHRPILLQELTPIALFASQAAAAIELNRQKNQLEWLIDSSPNGIIAIDKKALVTSFNKRAEEIIGYKADEVLGRPVENLYFYPNEPRRIGKELHTKNGEVKNYETFIKGKDERAIPIRHSSRWLFDSSGHRIGSVGYFEDLRQVKETERYLELLLKANNLIIQAENMAEGLQRLAEMIVTSLDTSFCRISLLDESKFYLLLKAHAVSRPGDWNSAGKEQISVADWQGLAEILENGAPRILRTTQKQNHANLHRWAEQMGLQKEIQSALVVPLKTHDRVVGLLVLGEVRPGERDPFTNRRKELVVAIAQQIVVLVDRLRLHETTERRGQLLEALDAASRHIRAEKEPRKLLKEIVRLAAELVGCKAGCLYINYPHVKELELKGVHGFPPNAIPERLGHDEGPISELLAETGKPHIISGYSHWPGREAILVPLKHAGDVVAVLLVVDENTKKQFSPVDLEILSRFAVHASLALQTAQLVGQEQRRLAQLAILHRISDYIQAAQDLNKILHVVLTGITAGYGLGYNRAALFLLDERRENLVGRMGIGDFDKNVAEQNWSRHNSRGLEDFGEYLRQLEQGAIPTTPMDERVRSLRMSVSSADIGILSKPLLDKTHILFSRPEEIGRFPNRFKDLFHPASPAVIIPLIARNQVIGIIYADTKFTQAPIIWEDIENLGTFANTAAIAIDNFRLLEQNRSAREKLQSLFESSNTLVSSRDPQQTLQEIVEQTRLAANASWVRLILIDERGRKRNPLDVLAVAEGKEGLDRESVVRPEGISVEVLRTGIPKVIEDANDHLDRISRYMIQENSQAALCLPLSVQGKRIGVTWIHYEKPRRFSPSEVDALQLYVNHTAIAYENARQMEELEHLSQAARAMSTASKLKRVLKTIVEEAKNMFRADYSLLWSFDPGRDQFLPEELVAVGYSEEELQRFKEIEPLPGGWSFKALRDGWASAEDIASTESPFDRESIRSHLKGKGVRSFQAVALKVGEEPIGVLYVSYKQPRAFDKEEDRRSLENFAAHAALALRNARLLDQVTRAKTGAKAVARMTTLGDHEATLAAIAEGTKKAVRCDAVVLYVYDQATGKLDHPPTMVGVRNPGGATRFEEVLHNSLVYRMLESDEPVIVEKTKENDLFKGSRFTKEEQIKSLAAISLKVAGRKVGIMFVNYHMEHRFTSEERADIQLFANQAAIAIRNAQLFEDAKKLREQEVLVKLSKELLGTVKQQEMLDRAVAVAADVLNTDLASIILPDNNGKLIFTAIAGPWKNVVVGETCLGGGMDSQTGYTILKKEPVIVINCAAETRFTVPRIVIENEIQSSMSAPMFSGNDVVGAMTVYARTPRQFNEAEKTLLSLVANQTAIAIKSAEQYEAIERKRAYLSALYEAGKALTTSLGLDLKQILDRIVQHAVECVMGRQGFVKGFGTIQSYDERTNELVCESAYPLEKYPNLTEKIGTRRSLGDSRIGITGRALKTKQPQLVQDVTNDPDYVEFNPLTRSQMTVPLLDQDKVIGVLSLESEQRDAFDEAAMYTLQALAELAVIAIRNAKQYQELKEVKGLVGSRTALAWTGMMSSTWRHSIGNHAITIRDSVKLLRYELNGARKNSEVDKQLDLIDRLANRILDRPITPPLSVEEGVQSVPINDLIRDRCRQLWSDEPYRSIPLAFDLKIDNSATTRASVEWLRRCIDVLIDNALEAMSTIPDRKLVLASHRQNGRAEISVIDNGKGIVEEKRTRIFREPINKPKGARGLGIGLMFAQTIVQTYGGEIRCESTGPAGTTMIISLPLEA
jgi:PAS domain S-box-containing protein